MSAKLGISKPLWLQITFCGFAAVLMASFSIGALALYRQSTTAHESVQADLNSTLAYVLADIEGQKRAAIGTALLVAGDPETADLIAANKPEQLGRRFAKNLSVIESETNLRLFTFSDAALTVVARIHAPKQIGDNLSTRRRMIVEAVRNGKLTVGIEPGREFLSVFATAPVFSNGAVTGAVDIGTPLTNDYFIRLKQSVHSEIAIHLSRGDHFDVQNSTYAGSPLLTGDELRSIFGGTGVMRVAAVGDKTFAVSGVVLKDFSGSTIGVLEVSADVTAMTQASTAALWTLILATLAVCSLVLLAFYVFARSLARAISKLTATMDRLAAGDIAANVPGQERHDEIGAMGRAVQVFKEAAIQKRRLEEETAAGREAAEAERRRTDGERAKAAAEQASVVDGLAASLGRLAHGDLTCRLDDTFAPDYERLRTDFNLALVQLQDTVRVISASSGAIRSGTGEIAIAADDLSRRTEHQAASLEETAAALDQITETVRRTAEGAGHASEAAIQTKADAEHSGAVVRQAVEAMSEIETSARQISQIIGVIDEIAFQTNLLALNAGVEAARAGDAGRGFAVVASEVRGLAQRSAEAAKEIKALISASSRQVERGVALVGETGGALEKIVTQVGDISSTIAVIAASVKEQAVGLEQVNIAVTEMDKVTQQNAAMVEESTAASHALSQEAEELATVTGRFQLDGRHTAAAERVAPSHAGAQALRRRAGGRG